MGTAGRHAAESLLNSVPIQGGASLRKTPPPRTWAPKWSTSAPLHCWHNAAHLFASSSVLHFFSSWPLANAFNLDTLTRWSDSPEWVTLTTLPATLCWTSIIWNWVRCPTAPIKLEVRGGVGRLQVLPPTSSRASTIVLSASSSCGFGGESGQVPHESHTHGLDEINMGFGGTKSIAEKWTKIAMGFRVRVRVKVTV